MAPEKSSYLRYLPPVLWENEPPLPEFSLGALLRIFEKILTGLEDNVEIRHTTSTNGPHTHEAIATTIERLPRLFDPWQTPQSFLPWLASWVALEFPALQGQALWDEYQQRKVTSVITQIYRQRGLKEGLNRYLDLFAVGETRPRVAIDDGSRLLIVRPKPGTIAQISALVSKGPVVAGSAVLAEGLVRPWCVAVGDDGNLFIGDAGISAKVSLPIKNRIWHISAAGEYDMVGSPPKPQPLAPDTLPLASVASLAVRPPQAGQPETLYILDGPSPGKLFQLPWPYTNTAATPVTSLASSGATFSPVAMAVDTNGDLLVLDRGDGPETANPPKIITVRLNPLALSRRSLGMVVEPLSLLVQPDGRLIIGDGREQLPAGEAQYPGNLVLIDRSNAANWTETLLLPAANPLVAPTALVREDDAHLYVLDAGLKPFRQPGDPFTVTVAEPAAIYRVDLSTDPPTVRRATETGHLVFPRSMAAIGGQLFICDPGQLESPRIPAELPRLQPFRFNVVVHFAEPRLPLDDQQRAKVQRQVAGNIRTIVDAQKPAHSLWDLITSVPDVL